MREILFRGKPIHDRCTIEWMEGGIKTKDGRAFIIGMSSKMRVEAMEVDPNTIGQYTGLTDNVRQRIFEGDIVSILPDDGEMGVIKWEDVEAMFVLEADGWCANFDNYFSTDLEVIGNIHDNKELLDGTKSTTIPNC